MRRTAAAALLACLAGCNGDASPAPAVAPPTAPAADGRAAPAEGGDIDPAKVALSKAMQAELEKFTPRRFTGPVKVANQTRAAFRSKMEAALDAELSPEKQKAVVAAYRALGLLPEDIDIRGALLDLMASQVAAYYERHEDTFYPISKGLPEANERLLFVHELQHALQDQALGLDAVMDAAEAVTDNTDRVQAARYLLEGEAHWVSFAWSAVDQGGQNPLQNDAVANQIFRRFARMRFDDLLAENEQHLALLGEEGGKQIEMMKRLPRWIVREQQEAYLVGAWGVHRIYKHGGWKAVDAVWKNPPTSTEQMLHPLEKLLGDRREEPVAVRLPDLAPVLGAGWSRVHADTLGEAGIHIVLSEQLPELKMGRARSGSKGWGGDRLAAWTKDGAPRPVLTWLTVWDTERDAEQFRDAYRYAAEARNGLREWPVAGLASREKAVAIVEGEADAGRVRQLLDALLAAAPK